MKLITLAAAAALTVLASASANAQLTFGMFKEHCPTATSIDIEDIVLGHNFSVDPAEAAIQLKAVCTDSDEDPVDVADAESEAAQPVFLQLPFMGHPQHGKQKHPPRRVARPGCRPPYTKRVGNRCYRPNHPRVAHGPRRVHPRVAHPPHRVAPVVVGSQAGRGSYAHGERSTTVVRRGAVAGGSGLTYLGSGEGTTRCRTDAELLAKAPKRSPKTGRVYNACTVVDKSEIPESVRLPSHIAHCQRFVHCK